MDGPTKKAGPKNPTAKQFKKALNANLAQGQVKKNYQILRSGLPQKQQAPTQSNAPIPASSDAGYTASGNNEIPSAAENATSSAKLSNVKEEKRKKVNHDMEEWIVFPHSNDKGEIEKSKTLQQEYLIQLNERLLKTKDEVKNLQAHVANLSSAYKQAADTGAMEEATAISKQIENANASLQAIGEGQTELEHHLFEADKNLQELNERLAHAHGGDSSLASTTQIGAAAGAYGLAKGLFNRLSGKKDEEKIQVKMQEEGGTQVSSNVEGVQYSAESAGSEESSVTYTTSSATGAVTTSSDDLPSTPGEMVTAFKSPKGIMKSLKGFSKLAMSGPQAAIAGAATKQALKASGIFGLMLYGILLKYAALGKAALTGALIGAGVGGLAGGAFGAYIGLQLAALTGPFAPLVAVVTVPTFTALGATFGATIGAIAGGLIAYGLASGSATAVSMGVGAGIGAGVGAYGGFLLGSTIAGGFISLAALACAATGIGCILVPIAAISSPLIIAATTAIGAAVGAAVGAYVGYIVGEYVLNPVKDAYTASTTKIRGGWDTLTGGGGIGGTVGGWLSGTWNFITGNIGAAGGWLAGSSSGAVGWVSGAWNSTASLAGNAISGTASLAGDLFNGLLSGGGQVLARIPAIGVGGAVGGAAVFHIFTGSFVTPASKFTAELDAIENFFPAGVNEHFTITKTANPPLIFPAPGPLETRQATFTVTVTAQSNLTNISLSDDTTTSNGSTFTTASDTCSAAPSTLSAGSPWTCTVVINVNATQDGAQVTNTATFTATPEGGTALTGTASATILVGAASAACGNFEFTPGTATWTSAEIDTVNQICNTLLARSPTLMALLNNATTITMVRNTGGCSGFVNGGTVVTFSGCNLSVFDSAKYVVIHELGHVIGNVNGPAYTAFLNSGAFDTEGMIKTYPLCPGDENESFAEMIADYVVGHTYNFPARCTGYPGGPYTAFQAEYPMHYNFARNVLFGGVTY